MTIERDLGMLETWEDQSDQLRAVGFIRCRKGVRNRLLAIERDLGMLETWEDQSDQLRAVGFIMC